MAFLVFILLASALSSTSASGDAAWGYVSAMDVLLPSKWDNSYEYCDGYVQSPIDIETGSCTQTDTTLGEITFTSYTDTGNTWDITNNGHTIGVASDQDPASDFPMTIADGGLSDGKTYQFLQFHVHWGADDTEGSEHTIDGIHYPLELHFVHFDDSFADISAAVSSGNWDALAVLGVMFEIGSTTNTFVDFILNDGGSNIEYAESDTSVTAFDLTDILPANTAEFFRYNGSLTTPTCDEIVQWTVFKEPLEVTSAQMASLRSTFKYNEDGETDVVMSTNFRPVQALNGRNLLATFGAYGRCDTTCGACSVSVSLLLAVMGAVVAEFCKF